MLTKSSVRFTHKTSNKAADFGCDLFNPCRLLRTCSKQKNRLKKASESRRAHPAHTPPTRSRTTPRKTPLVPARSPPSSSSSPGSTSTPGCPPGGRSRRHRGSSFLRDRGDLHIQTRTVVSEIRRQSLRTMTLSSTRVVWTALYLRPKDRTNTGSKQASRQQHDNAMEPLQSHSPNSRS